MNESSHRTNEDQLGFLRNTAFPTSFKTGPNQLHVAVGLTKRELFAAMAMQALLSNPTTKVSPAPGYSDEQAVAGAATKMADALLTALDQSNG